MFTTITDHHNLSTAFARLSMVEAMRVKRNISHVFTSLKMPSDALVAQMRQEGLIKTVVGKSPNTYVPVAQSVIQSHLVDLFLDAYKLQKTLSGFSLSELVACKEAFDLASHALNLPSASLAAMMEQEGVAMEHLDPEQKRINDIKAKLNGALTPQNTNAADPNAIKARLNALSQSNSLNTDNQIKKSEQPHKGAKSAVIGSKVIESEVTDSQVIQFNFEKSVANS